MRRGHHREAIAGCAFDDDGARVATTSPEVYREVEETTDADDRLIDVVREALIISLRYGHRDSAITRLAVLARMIDVFPSDRLAGKAAGVSRSTITRARLKLRAELRRAAHQKKATFPQ